MTIPPAVALAAADFGPTFRSEGAPYPVTSIADPCAGCAPIGTLGNQPQIAGLGETFKQGANGVGAVAWDFVLRFDVAGGRSHDGRDQCSSGERLLGKFSSAQPQPRR